VHIPGILSFQVYDPCGYNNRRKEKGVKITVIAVGKVKEKYIESGIKEYRKRLGPYCRLNIIEVSDQRAPENLSRRQLEEVKDREGRNILKHIKPGNHVIALDIGGEQMSSEDMAGYIERLVTGGSSSIIFVIGGSNGLSKGVLGRSDMKLSFSAMTFPHQLMRLILLEQIYRWFKINRGEPYHK
jgi:23S rRNA (pseudouridine1915-N3)-methyltransferase